MSEGTKFIVRNGVALVFATALAACVVGFASAVLFGSGDAAIGRAIACLLGVVVCGLATAIWPAVTEGNYAD